MTKPYDIFLDTKAKSIPIDNMKTIIGTDDVKRVKSSVKRPIVDKIL